MACKPLGEYLFKSIGRNVQRRAKCVFEGLLHVYEKEGLYFLQKYFHEIYKRRHLTAFSARHHKISLSP